MSNRRRPRDPVYSQLVAGPGAAAFVQAWRCPDCMSSTSVAATDGPVPTVEVHHDPGCPWMAARTTSERSRA